MSGNGYWSFLEIQLRPRKSMQSRREPSFFSNEENWGSMGRPRRLNESCGKVFINELMQSRKFLLGQGVNGAKRQGSAFVQCDFEIVGSMVG